jgi:hypothetical protein
VIRRLIGVVMAVAALGAVFAVPVAQADTTDIIEPQFEPPNAAKSGFQAMTCEEDEPLPEPTVFCTPETESRFFIQAAGHPEMGFTQYIIQHGEVEAPPFGTLMPIKEPIAGRAIKTLRVDLPPGLTVNPEATPRCPLATFEEPPASTKCPESTIVGREEVTLVVNTPNAVPAPSPPFPPGTFFPVGFVIKPSKASGTNVNLYNLEPEEGEPAKFGFVVAGTEKVFLTTDAAWESDFHESFTIARPPPKPPFSTLKSRLLSKGRSGDGTFITLPTTCVSDAEFPHLYSTWFRAESHEVPNPEFPNGSTPVEAPLPPGELEGCELVPFEPGIEVDPKTSQVDSPSPAEVTVTLPFDPAKEGGEVEEVEPGVFNGVSQSHVRSAEVALPQGMGLNPSGANGLVACTDAQFAKGVRVEDNTCPADSDIGTVEVETPPLPEGSLKGDVYVGEQKSSDPTSGEEFRVLAEAKSKQYGIVARLVGHVVADPATGQLTVVLDEQEVGPLAGPLPDGLPQVPFESVKVRLDGSKAVLSSPPTCSVSETTSAMEPWARPGTFALPTAEFTLSSIPGGGTCPVLMADRPFAPGYTAKSDNTKGGAYSPFRVHIGRPDGQQELKGVDVTLPEGLTGKLAGVPYCPESAIAAAVAVAGTSERASSSCPAASQIGTTSTEAGTGSNPLKIAGKAFLAGPYKGAPLSFVAITPAVAGPFDLGTVVVRVALFVNPETTQVRALSDVIPDVFGGVKLDIRTIDVDVDRAKFMRNPTSCKAKSIAGFLNGGGADPTNPATFSAFAISTPYQATGCKGLKFKPKLFTRLLGGPGVTTRAKHPKLRAVLEAREKDANLRRSALVLPNALFLDQGNINTVCTRPQLAARECPKAAVYGHARAKTPLLDNPLKGPVYMVSSTHELPDLVADLRGQVNVQLHGIISSKPGGGIKTVFNPVPDVPVKKFILWMKGGAKQGLLVNSRNLCDKPLSSFMNLKAQNGRRVRDKNLPLKVGGCNKR